VKLTSIADVGVISGPQPAPVHKDTCRYQPRDDQKDVPGRYRLQPRTVTYEMKLKFEMPANEVSVYRLQFPSAVETPYPENNTVHAEYCRPMGKGPFPAVIVLDIARLMVSVDQPLRMEAA